MADIPSETSNIGGTTSSSELSSVGTLESSSEEEEPSDAEEASDAEVPSNAEEPSDPAGAASMEWAYMKVPDAVTFRERAREDMIMAEYGYKMMLENEARVYRRARRTPQGTDGALQEIDFAERQTEVWDQVRRITWTRCDRAQQAYQDLLRQVRSEDVNLQAGDSLQRIEFHCWILNTNLQRVLKLDEGAELSDGDIDDLTIPYDDINFWALHSDAMRRNY